MKATVEPHYQAYLLRLWRDGACGRNLARLSPEPAHRANLPLCYGGTSAPVSQGAGGGFL